MDLFKRQCLRLGATYGWRHFDFEMRSKEEIIVTVHSGRGSAQGGSSDTVFLLAGYEKYGRPYVWLRTPSAEFQLSESQMDMPIALETTDEWLQADPSGVAAWDIVAELVALVVRPLPLNPLEIDFLKLAGDTNTVEFSTAKVHAYLGKTERALNYAAVSQILHEAYLSNSTFSNLVGADMRQCVQRHFQDMRYVLSAS